MRFCIHTHCFPDALAPKAMAVLTGNATGEYRPFADGTAGGAERLLRSAGVDGAMICNIATNPKQQSKVNDFAIAMNSAGGFFRAAGSIHPDSPDPAAELDRLKAAGIKGIKLHPDYAGVDFDDPRYDRILSLADERGLFVITHAGYDPVSPRHIHVTVPALRRAIDAHPGLTLIAAHMGSSRQSDEVLKLLVGTDIRLDTSLCSTRPGETEDLRLILHRHDPDRLYFGTDTPWTDPAAEIRFVEEADLPADTLEKIFRRNACKLLGLEEE